MPRAPPPCPSPETASVNIPCAGTDTESPRLVVLLLRGGGCCNSRGPLAGLTLQSLSVYAKARSRILMIDPLNVQAELEVLQRQLREMHAIDPTRPSRGATPR